MTNLDSLRTAWVNVRSFAALHGIYDAETDQRAYAAIVHGDTVQLEKEINSLAARARINASEVKFSKPRTKNPATEKGTRAFAIEAHAKLAAENFVPMKWTN